VKQSGAMSIGLPKDSPFADDDSAVSPSAPPSLEGAGLLIVDEDPAFQLGLKTFARDYVGFSSVFTASNGREALEKLAAEPSIEVITLDYRMPEMDGIEFLEALRANPPKPLSVIMITGYPSEQLEGEFRSFGSSQIRTEHFLSKPVAFEKLEPIILRSYKSLKALQLPPAPDPAMTENTEPSPNRDSGKPAENDDTSVISPDQNELTLAPDHETKVASGLEVLRNKIEELEKKIDRINRRTPSRFGRLFMDIVKFLIVAGLVLAAWHTGLIDRFFEWIDSLNLGIGSGENGGGESTVPLPVGSDKGDQI
jgi:CheY-like chemotaxis protein